MMPPTLAPTLSSSPLRPSPALPGGQVVTIVSGKGGVGKTNLVANLAVAAAGRGGRVLLLDGDLGLANIDILLGLIPAATLADVVEGRCPFEAALLSGPRGVEILAAASGRADLAAGSDALLELLIGPVRDAAATRDLVLIDAGAGIGPAAIRFATASDRTWLVTTPEPTSLADAYATLKVIHRTSPGQPVELIVNSVRGELEARATHHKLERLALRFLERPLALGGFLPRDRCVEQAVALQRTVVEAFPDSAVARRLVGLAARLMDGRGADPRREARAPGG